MSTLTMEYELPHPPKKVWRALTEPALVAKWLMMSIDGAPVANGDFTLRTEPSPWWDGVVNCTVLELELYKRLRYTWKSGTGKNGLDTIVTWTLEPTATGTRLHLEHSGFTEQNGFAFGGAKAGWARNVDERMRALLAEVEG